MSTLLPNPISQYIGGNMPLLNKPSEEAWDSAIDAVDYPVKTVPLFYKNDQNEDTLAMGITNTGRDNQFFAVNTDRNRSGVMSTIATVTDTYGTIETKNVYSGLREELKAEGVAGTPISVYVSGNGGCQSLIVRMDGLSSLQTGTTLEMIVSLQTSLDGSKNHSLRVGAWHKENGYEVVGLGGLTLSSSARHTKTIDERHTAMILIVNRLVNEWNAKIVPMIKLFWENEFSQKLALQILEDLMKASEIGERHIKSAMDSYAISKKETHTIFGVLDNLSSYLTDEMGDKQDRLELFRKNINKNIDKVLKKHQIAVDETV